MLISAAAQPGDHVERRGYLSHRISKKKFLDSDAEDDLPAARIGQTALAAGDVFLQLVRHKRWLCDDRVTSRGERPTSRTYVRGYCDSAPRVFGRTRCHRCPWRAGCLPCPRKMLTAASRTCY